MNRVVVNNPSMLALACALDCRMGATMLEQVKLLSLGTGKIGHFVKGNSHDWGASQWASKMLYIMLEGSTELINFEAKMVLDDHFHRVDPVLRGTFSLDNWKKIPELVDLATEYNLEPTFRWIKENWK